jgi:predicted transcriptional regulator
VQNNSTDFDLDTLKQGIQNRKRMLAKYLKQSNNLTYQTLAEMMQCSVSTAQKYLSGDRPITKNALDCLTRELKKNGYIYRYNS